MKVTIWDLDYYFAENKKNLINTDVQKISSYHKQKGDTVNFVLTEYDINRPYDVYYIIKENKKTPNPPLNFWTNPKVRWWGKAYEMRQNWKMTDAMLACRPDYLLYPNCETRLERAERIRLIGNNNNLLPVTQDWSNTFKDKYYIVTDEQLWYCSEDVIVAALDRIKDINSISFEAPVWIEKIMKSPAISEKFFQLKISTRSQIQWMRVKLYKAEETIEWIKLFKEKFPYCPIKPLEVVAAAASQREQALKDFEELKRLIIKVKREKFFIKIISPKRINTPFFFLLELIENWSKINIKLSWLEFISTRYKVEKNTLSGVTDWNKPKKWPPLFRDALRQTYKDKTFLLLQWGEEKISDLEIPWSLWEEEFKLGL